MSAVLDPREILSYLNELGYTNITAQQLKDFMKDLKKLIKYDLRKQQQKINPPLTENIPELSKFAQIDSYLYSTPSAASPRVKTNATENKRAPNKPSQDDSYLYSTASVPSPNAKTKGNIITVEVKRPRRNKCVSTNARPTDSCEANNKKEEEKVEKEEIESEVGAVRANKIGKSKSAGRVAGKSQVILKPGASFIRPRELRLKKSKSDPVTLYHQYQAEWKKIRFPGEDARPNLRWAIREKMMGGDTGQQRPVSTAASMNAIARKKQDSRNV